jgi:chaperonin GroEL|tara:strand:- start:2572 stop:4146 length:1575 start_codon:yes stop_codon:yes gene_type:complete
MDYNNPSTLIKDLNFGDEAKNKVIMGVEKLSKAVKSTLGASGKCVIYEDARGNPVITKDGVTVAESVVLFDPVENMGATLVKEAARKTVQEAGDGTTTATVLAEALLKEVNKPEYAVASIRDIKEGIHSGVKKINKYLSDTAIEVKGDMLDNVAAISCNNDKDLGKIIAEAYTKVGKDGVVFMEESETERTYVDVVEGIQLDNGLTSPHFITNQDKQKAELDNPYVLIVSSEIPNVRKIQKILEFVIKKNKALLIVAPVSQQVKSALLMNKVKGNIKVNIIDLPGFGPTKKDTTEDLAIATGATVINEELGDDLDVISIDHLGEVEKSVTDAKTTVITTDSDEEELDERINSIKKLIKKEKNPLIAENLQKRIAMLKGSVGIIKVGADTKVELKEKKDRVEDAIYATKAALKEGIVPGGGIALLNATNKVKLNKYEKVLVTPLIAPFQTILANAGIVGSPIEVFTNEAIGIDVITGKTIDMVKKGIVDPVLVTKSALKNAVSVVTTIISADCVISNMRGDESNK